MSLDGPRRELEALGTPEALEALEALEAPASCDERRASTLPARMTWPCAYGGLHTRDERLASALPALGVTRVSP